MNAMMKVLIEDSVRVRKLSGPTRVGVTDAIEIGVVGIVGSIAILGSLGMSMTTRQE